MNKLWEPVVQKILRIRNCCIKSEKLTESWSQHVITHGFVLKYHRYTCDKHLDQFWRLYVQYQVR